jgi:hypothetical protein
MSEPASQDDYDHKFHANRRVEGYGFETTTRMPCPFCAEPDFMVFRTLEGEAAMSKGAVCRHCGRGARALVTHEGGYTQFEFVQTAGPDAPAWMTPKMRRESGE